MEEKNYNNVQVIFIRVETEAKRRKKNIKKNSRETKMMGRESEDEMLREAKKSEKNIIESRNNFPTLAAASASHLYSVFFIYSNSVIFLWVEIFFLSNNRYASVYAKWSEKKK